jgi:sugar/nucleoside kinase (ribokinase family)
VNVESAVRRNAPNQHAVILLDEPSGERCVLWDRDERLNLEASELPIEDLSRARLLHVDDVDQEAAIRAAERARAAGVPVTSDLDRMTDLTGRLVAAVSHPILAEGLAEQFTGIADHERALRKIRERHDGLLCITLGRDGAVALDGDRFIHSPGFEVRAVDTTGSGDVFRAGFIFGLLAGWDTDLTLRLANAAAAVSCTRIGAMDGVPTWDEIAALAPDLGTGRHTGRPLR